MFHMLELGIGLKPTRRSSDDLTKPLEPAELIAREIAQVFWFFDSCQVHSASFQKFNSLPLQILPTLDSNRVFTVSPSSVLPDAGILNQASQCTGSLVTIPS
jgi:hypothetical protein